MLIIQILEYYFVKNCFCIYFYLFILIQSSPLSLHCFTMSLTEIKIIRKIFFFFNDFETKNLNTRTQVTNIDHVKVHEIK